MHFVRSSNCKTILSIFLLVGEQTLNGRSVHSTRWRKMQKHVQIDYSRSIRNIPIRSLREKNNDMCWIFLRSLTFLHGTSAPYRAVVLVRRFRARARDFLFTFVCSIAGGHRPRWQRAPIHTQFKCAVTAAQQIVIHLFIYVQNKIQSGRDENKTQHDDSNSRKMAKRS